MRVLVINCGSSSVKYQLIDTATSRALEAGVIERIGEDGKTYEAAVGEILERVASHEPQAVGHRVVHGGERFHDATRIDDEVVVAIEECIPLAPLHNPTNLSGIRVARGETEVRSPRPNPIAISGRHVHLDRPSMDPRRGHLRPRDAHRHGRGQRRRALPPWIPSPATRLEPQLTRSSRTG